MIALFGPRGPQPAKCMVGVVLWKYRSCRRCWVGRWLLYLPGSALLAGPCALSDPFAHVDSSLKYLLVFCSARFRQQ